MPATRADYLDTPRVAASFDQAASRYAEVSDLQAEVAGQLLARLAWIKLQPRVILDVGCGCGRLTRALARRHPGARIYALDIAPGMLREAKRQSPRWFARQHFLCADAAALPLANDQADWVVSNLMLQWCNDPLQVFGEFQRVLKPGGVLLFSTFGPQTLRELRDSWARAEDGHLHVNHFQDMHDLGDALLAAGLRDAVTDAESLRRHYPDALALMRHLKAMGAHNSLAGRSRGLLGRRRLQAVTQAYETLRQAEGIPATFEIIHGHARAPENKTARPSMETAIPLNQIQPGIYSIKPTSR